MSVSVPAVVDGGRMLEAVHETLCRLESRWLPPLPGTDTFFGYDPLPLALFLDGIGVAVEWAPGDRFLDVGCGIGTKMALMASLGFRVSGVDRYWPYVEVAGQLVPEADVVVADAFEVDAFDADIVYMYRPAVSDADEAALERHVVDRMNEGSVLFLPARQIPDGWGLRKVGQNVWVR